MGNVVLWLFMHASSLPETNKAHLEVGGASNPLQSHWHKLPICIEFFVCSSSYLCACKWPLPPGRCYYRDKGTISGEIYCEPGSEDSVYYTGGRRHPIDTSSRHPFLESVLPSSQVHPGSLSPAHSETSLGTKLVHKLWREFVDYITHFSMSQCTVYSPHSQTNTLRAWESGNECG